MKKMLMAATLLSVMTMAIHSVHAAGPTAISNVSADAQAGAQAGADGNVLNAAPMTNTTTVGPSTSNAKLDSSISSSPTASVGLTLKSEGSKIPLGTPNAVMPQIPAAQIFGDLTQRPAAVRGVPVVLEALQQCGAVATQEHPLGDAFDDGHSGKTQVVWSPNQNYFAGGGTTVVLSSPTGETITLNGFETNTAPRPVIKGVTVKRAQVMFPTRADKYSCLGVMTVSAKSGTQIPLTTVASDARIYALDKMSGYPDIYLVSVPEAIAAAESMNTAGSGIGVSPGIVGSAANMLTAGMISAGFGTGKSNAVAGAELGCTFFVLSHSGSNDTIIDPGKVSSRYSTDREQGKKPGLAEKTDGK